MIGWHTLPNQQDKGLIKYINKHTERGLFASLERSPKKLWPGRFLKLQQDDLSTYTTAIDAARKRADSATNTLYIFSR
jgi:hypothetical protein